MRFYSAHSMFDEMTLSGICYFSLINGSLHFKQWDPGTNKAPGSDHPITILIVCLEDKTIIGTVGEWIHEPFDPLYVCFVENWYKCPAIEALNIPACLRRLLELLYVDEYPNYLALKYDAALVKSTLSSCKDACLRNCLCLVLFCENSTARCFHLDQIGHFQHFKKVKSGYVLCVTCSKAMLTDWGQFSVSAIHIAFSCIRFPNFFLDYVGTNANFLNESHPTIIFELAPSSSFWSIFVIVNTMLVLQAVKVIDLGTLFELMEMNEISKIAELQPVTIQNNGLFLLSNKNAHLEGGKGVVWTANTTDTLLSSQAFSVGIDIKSLSKCMN
jgi:hypothetical protein